MIIAGGQYKGLKLAYPKDRSFRPTKQIVKEAIFNILQSYPDHYSSFLDLFAGSGSVGLEAYSRGFTNVVLIDQDTKYLKQNLTKISPHNSVQIYKNDSLKALEILYRKNQKFSVVFIDPPYNSPLAQNSLNKISHFDILEDNALILVETETNQEIDWQNFVFEKEYRYGLTALKLLRKGSS